MPTDDYINRSDALSLIVGGNELIGRGWLIKELATLPAADVEPVRHGRWEVADYAEPDHHGVCVAHYPGGGLYCTECLHGWKRERVEGFECCPHCGAKMDKEESK